MPRAFGHALTVLKDGTVLVTGGGAGPLDVQPHVERVDVASGRSWPVAPLTTARAAHTAVLLADGSVLVAGGLSTQLGTHVPPERYDPVKDRWQRMTTPGSRSMRPNDAAYVHAVALPDGSALLAGGTPHGVDRVVDASFKRESVADGGGHVWMASLPDGRVVMVTEHATWVRDTGGGWTAVTQGSPLRRMAGWALLSDRRVLMTGGTSDSGRPVSTCAVFSLADGSWRRAPTLDHARSEHLCAPLPNGGALVLGGFSGRQVRRDSLHWDGAADRWVSAGRMLTFRATCAAATLPDGRVLVVGGLTDAPGYQGGCEVWTDLGRTDAQPKTRRGSRPGAQAHTGPDDAERERAVLAMLRSDYRTFNADLGDALTPAVLELADLKGSLAQWISASRTIRVSRQATRELLWPQVRELLHHEMAHQYVTEVLRVTDESAHGAAFQKVCARFGVDPRAAGVPNASLDPQEDVVVRRVRKLQALAQSSNPHEAHTAQQLAEDLMGRYRALFAAADVNLPKAEEAMGTRHVGGTRVRRDAFDFEMAGLLALVGAVEVIWVPSLDVDTLRQGMTLELCGTQANVERAAYLHDVLRRSIEALWEQDRSQHGGGARDRVQFMVGTLRAFAEKVRAEKVDETQKALVRMEAARAEAWMNTRHPRLSHRRGATVHLGEAALRGAEAGRSLQVNEGLGAQTGPRQLGPKR